MAILKNRNKIVNNLPVAGDPGLRDQRFGSTPLGGARYFGPEQLIEPLAPVTAADELAAADGSAR